MAMSLAAASPLLAAAQDTGAGASKLQSVAVNGSKLFTSDEIVRALDLHPGAMVTRNDFQHAADRLSIFGFFASVRYTFSTSSAGVKLTFEVSDAPTLPVTFDNFVWFSDDEINRALKEALVLYAGTVPESGDILGQISEALEKMLLRRGVRADVTHEIATIPETNARAMNYKAEGVALTIASVEFGDPLAKSDATIQERLADLAGKAYSRNAVERFEFEQVRPVYLARAYLRVKFPTPSGRLAGDPSKPGENQVIVVAPIEPGAEYTLGAFTWTGNSAIPSEELEKMVGLKPGGPANGNFLEAGWTRIEDAYHNIGYLDAGVKPAVQFDDKSGRANYVVAIAEGPQYRMGELVLSGLSNEGERRIRNAWKIPQGAVFDEGVYEDFLSAGVKQAFEGLPFHYQKIEHFLERNPQTAAVDVMLNFD